MPELSLAVANFFLDAAEDEAKELTQMQVLKLSYIAHGWHLGLYGEPLFLDPVEAWDYGPVVPAIYREFWHFRKRPIDGRAREYFSVGEAEAWREPKPTEPPVLDHLNEVWDGYKGYTGLELSAMTHKPGTPWDQVTQPYLEQERPLPPHLQIPRQVIEKYYKGMARS